MDPLAVIAVVGAVWALLASFVTRRRLDRCQGQVSTLKEQLRQLSRKKVRRRNPRTGRFESVYEDDVDE